MYNKRDFSKINNKKILHKVRKQWVVISVALLGVLGVSGLTARSTHAKTNEVPASQTDSLAESSGSSGTALVSSAPQSVNATNSSRAVNSQSNVPSNGYKSLNSIQQRAKFLYQQILTDGIQHVNHHHNSTGNVSSTVDPSGVDQRSNVDDHSAAVTGLWGTAPFKFDPTSGLLQTTGEGIIMPITQLDSDQVPLDRITSIRFAPGTEAPMNASNLLAAGYDAINTTDGPSDSVAYVSQLRNLKSIDLSNLDTSYVTNMANMISNDSDLQSINFGNHFDTSSVQATAGMFKSDIHLRSLDLSSFNTANDMDMDSMFQSDYDLSSLNLGPHFDTRYGVYMYDMFRSDDSLKHLDLGNLFDTSNVVDDPGLSNHGFSHMFTNDYQLSSLDLGPKFTTRNATNLSDMFANDSDLTSLDLGHHFYTAQASDLHNMFKGDSSLRTLNLGDHFDTTYAGDTSYTVQGLDKNLYTDPDVYVTYHGADDLFRGDLSLNTIMMTNGRLTKSVGLPKLPEVSWYLSNHDQAQGSSVALDDGKSRTGIYKLYTNVPVERTQLNFENSNRNSVDRVTVSGLQGTPIPFGVLVNNLPSGYKLATSKISGLIQDIPNTPYRYQSASVNIPVESIDSVTPVAPHRSSKSTPNYSLVAKSAAEAADGRIAAYYRNSVSASVATANHSKASVAAQKADQRIADYYRNSVSSSVTTANHRAAESAAQQVDKKISEYYQNSVATSVSVANQHLAKAAAQSADRSIANSYRASVTASVVSANHQVAEAGAQRANEKIANYYRDSVATSVSTANQLRAQSTAQSADRGIIASYQASVAASVSLTNQHRAQDAAQSADRSIVNSYRASVSASVSSASHQKAEAAASTADKRIDQSIAASAAKSAEAKRQASYQASLAQSTSVINQRRARLVAQSADRSIANSYRNSVFASVASANHQKAESAAQSADQRIMESYQSSVATSVSVANQQRATSAAHLTDEQIDRSIANSATEIADRQIKEYYQSSVAQSVSVMDQHRARAAAQSADQRIAESYRTSVATSIADANSQKASAAARSADERLDRSIANSAAQHADERIQSRDRSSLVQPSSATAQRPASLTSSSVAQKSIKAPTELSLASSQSSQVSLLNPASFVSSSAQSTSQSSVNARTSSVSASFDSSARSASAKGANVTLPNQLRIGQTMRYHHVTLTRRPVRVGRWLNVAKSRVVYGRLFGKRTQGHLKRGTLIRILKVFQIRQGRRKVYRYEFKSGHRSFFIDGNRQTVKLAYIQPNELRRRTRHGRCRAIILKDCRMYKRPNYAPELRARNVHRGKTVTIERIVSIGRKGDHQTRFQLTNGLYITANRDFIKLI